MVDLAAVDRVFLEREIELVERQRCLLQHHLVDDALAAVGLGVGAPQRGGDLVALAPEPRHPHHRRDRDAGTVQLLHVGHRV